MKGKILQRNAMLLLIIVAASGLIILKLSSPRINKQLTPTHLKSQASSTATSRPTVNTTTVTATVTPTATTALAQTSSLDQKYQEGYTAFNNKEYSKAISLENQVINADPTYYKAYNVKGIALCYSHQFQEGMSLIDKSLSLKPDFGYARFNKALAYELYGYYDQALYWYDQALQVEKYEWSYYGIAAIYGRRGDVTNTVKYLGIAINMDPGVKAVARDESDFDPVKNSAQFQALVN